MDRSFATSIAPVIRTALEHLDEIQRRPTDWDVAQVQDAQLRVQKALEKAERQLKPKGEESWSRVQYALIAWIDEQNISLPWQGKEWWRDNSLEMSYYRSKNAHNDFYVYAEDAIRKNDRNAVECFFLCVVLGFRGIYIDLRSQNSEYAERAREFITRNQMKPDLRDWLKRTSEFLPIGQSSSRLSIESTEGFGAPPLNGRADFVSSLAFAVIGLGALLGYLYYLYKTNGGP
ncbi:MAG: DotU family type IV/VI secretion system protein [Planctomycetota bacterium]